MDTRLLTDTDSLRRAQEPVDRAVERFRKSVRSHARRDGADRHQLAAYELAWAVARQAAAKGTTEWAERAGDELSVLIASVATAESILRLRHLCGSGDVYGVDPSDFDDGDILDLLEVTHAPEILEAIGARVVEAEGAAESLGADASELRRRFRRFAETVVAPVAQEVHRRDLDVPASFIEGAASHGLFGFSVPEAYGGGQTGELDPMPMLVATEELASVSLLAGSLITRPEILIRALLKGGTEEQRRRWLPAIASGRSMVAVAVSERGHGSDVGGITCRAGREADGSWVVTGGKYWCGFAARAELIALLARTSDRGHRGLTLFVVEKPAFAGHEFEHRGEAGGLMRGRAIPTIGYRGMHTYELEFDRYRLPANAVVGGAAGADRGFYLQMEGFSMSRLQTAARGVGVLQAAGAARARDSRGRAVFGRPIAEYQLPLAMLARMAVRLASSRRLTYSAARELRDGHGQIACALAKMYSARMAETVARDALQLHGGIGYSEETPVSRYFVDARLLPIFEGTEEVLALRVIAKALLDD